MKNPIKYLVNAGKYIVDKGKYITTGAAILSAFSCTPKTRPVQVLPVKNPKEIQSEYVGGASDSSFKWRDDIKAHEKAYPLMSEKLRKLYGLKRDFLQEWDENLDQRLKEIERDRKNPKEGGLEGISGSSSDSEETSQEDLDKAIDELKSGK